jgi:hypothetical protein
VARRTAIGSRPAKPAVRGDGRGASRRHHLSPGTRAALARTRLVAIVPAGPSRLHSSAPPRRDEPPVVLHPLWAPAHPRRADGTDRRTPVRRAHALHPAAAPRRGTRPGRRPRPVVPFDIPVEAFAVEVGGSAHPAVRSLGDRRLVYIEHRHAVRRAYRRRQLVLAVGLSGAFVAVAGAALAPGRHASAVVGPRFADATRTADRAGAAPSGTGPVEPPRAPEPPYGRARRLVPAAVPARPRPRADDRDERSIGIVSHNFAAPPSRWLADDAFLVCTRGIESDSAGGYRAIDDSGTYYGAYQFDQPTWDGTVEHLRSFGLVGMRPDHAAPWVQDEVAYALYKWQGASHWHYRCAGLP